MPSIVIGGALVTVYSTAEIDAVLAPLAGLPDAVAVLGGHVDGLAAQVAAVAPALAGKVSGLNGVAGIWRGTEAELAAAAPYDPSVIYLAA